MSVRLHLGDCLDVLPGIPDASVDCVITDPPYPEIDRAYGRLSEAEWWALVVNGVIPEVRRVLKPSGSAVFILQPNSRKVGSMRGWLFEFQAWCCREWNIVQDHWWWNTTALPTVHSRRTNGLARPSLKACVWLGPPDCYRDQSSVLWSQSERSRMVGRFDRALRYYPSGVHVRQRRCAAAADERGGVTPFNVLPLSNTNNVDSAGVNGHGAGTPRALANWWVRYLCPPGGVVLDPFSGSGTVPLEALKLGRSAIGIERDPGYHATAERRIREAENATTLLNGVNA